MRKTVLCIIALLSACIVISAQNERVLVAKWDSSNGAYGFSDTNGTLVIPGKYDEVVFNFYQGVACVVIDGKYYLIDESGKEITKSYTWIDTFDSHNLCLVNKGGKRDDSGVVSGGKFGYIDLHGTEVIPVKYEYIGGFNDAEVAMVNQGGKYNKYGDFEGGKNGFVDISGNVLVAPKYTFVGQFTDDGIAWTNVGGKLDEAGECTGGKYGYVDLNGNEVASPKYDHVGLFTDDGHCWVNKGGKPYASKKKTENQISAMVKERTGNEKDRKKIFEAQAQVEDEVLGTKWDVTGNRIVGGKFGFINRSGREVVPLKYTKVADRFVDGCAWVATKKYGYYNENGYQITNLAYDDADDFYNGVAIVTSKDKIRGNLKGLINTDGTEITKQEYSWIGPMESGFAFVKSFSGYDRKQKRTYPVKYGFVNDQGMKLTDMKYDGGFSISNGVAICKIGEDLGYVDSLGREITPFGLLEAKAFQNGVALVKISDTDASSCRQGSLMTVTTHTKQNASLPGKYGLINREGYAVTDFVYDSATNQHEGLIAVSVNGQGAGWIDLEGNVAIPLQYQSAGNFIDGISFAKLNDKFGLIDKHNNVIVDFQYDGIYNHLTDYVVGARQGTQWGAIDYSGNTVIPFDFNTSDEVAVISREVYEPNGLIPLTEKDVQRFKIRIQNLTRHFSIESTIPNGYWDF